MHSKSNIVAAWKHNKLHILSAVNQCHEEIILNLKFQRDHMKHDAQREHNCKESIFVGQQTPYLLFH